MAVPVAAIAKRVAVALASDKKVLKKIGGIILGILVLIFMPFAVINAMFNGGVKVDTVSISDSVMETMSAEGREQIQKIDTTFKHIEQKMKKKNFSAKQITTAQQLFFTAFLEKAGDTSFEDKLVSCFKKNQSDDQLIAAVNKKFGVELTKDFLTKYTTVGNSDIVNVAKKEIGNVGGEKYWRWFGFDGHVHWCACFVSWCANQCGYLDQGLIPRTAGCLSGIAWFQERGLWINGGQVPKPGMIIYFDWELDGLADHVGIVEKFENGKVYTIEGNSSDMCRERQYDQTYECIYGYGTPRYPSSAQSADTASGDAATQVWTYLKSYGYSDSVAAGIIGNMMRECGGDTLDLDWDAVGQFNGDEYYGLCQWCLNYTPSGFKGSSIKTQCNYLHQTIASAFASYGGNYNGITYSEFLNADTRKAAIAFERVYERCGDYANEDTHRANNAEVAYKKFHK